MKLRVLILVCAVAALALGFGLAGLQRRYVAGVFVPDGQAFGKRPGSPATDDTVYSFPTPGTWPAGLAWDGQYFWVSDIDDAMIYRLDTVGSIMRSFAPPDNFGSGDLEWADGHLWFVSEVEGLLYALDTLTGAPLRSFVLPDTGTPRPSPWGLTSDGQYFWHSQYGNARIYKLDPANGQVLFSFPPPTSSILGIAWDGFYLWGVDISSLTIYVMNPPDSSAVASFPGQLPYPLGLKWVGPDLWNVDGNFCRVYKITGVSGLAEKGKLPVSGPLGSICPNPFASRAVIRWTSSGDAGQEPMVFDASGRPVRTLVSGRMPSGSQSAIWDGRDDAGQELPCGAYFVRLHIADRMETQRLVKVY